MLVGRARRSLTPAQWRTVGWMAAVVGGLHAAGLALLLPAVGAARTPAGAAGGLTLGIGLTAYTLGMRHAFDADHISAIDNTTRKLMSDDRRPLSVGFFFSLGHSTIVLALTLLFAAGVRAVGGQVAHGGSPLHQIGGWVGTTVSGTFLCAIGLVNLTILVGIVRAFRAMRADGHDEAALEARLRARGGMGRVFGRVTRMVSRPWQMYPVGVLFGLGFDTASEVALLFLAAGAAGSGLPLPAILSLPLLFAAGMSLLDTLDGSLMTFAYGWAFASPVRKVYYNIAVTGLSVIVALGIGTVELAGACARRAGATGTFWAGVESVDLNTLGFAIVGTFALTWAVAVAVWRVGRFEERWTRR